MKNSILILAQGFIAEEFVRIINNKRIADTSYTIVTPSKFSFPSKITTSIEHISLDPTSYSKIRYLFNKNDFSMVFILLSSLEEAGESLKNIRRIDEKIYIVLLDSWNAFNKLKQSSTQVVNSNEVLANHLYNFLPGVPVIARNVGLGEGEIIEVLVPFGSPFSYRHIGSIQQIKWRIVAIYRDKKLILPTNATMIRPQDILLLIGKPQVLNNLFQRIQKRNGMFPEPFGRNIYLLLDFSCDKENAQNYIQEVVYLLNRLEGRSLIIRIINLGDFSLLRKIRSIDTKNIDILVDYTNNSSADMIKSDIDSLDIGIVFISYKVLKEDRVFDSVYESKKLIYLFGKTALQEIKEAVILMSSQEEMDSISSTSFYISETLGLSLSLYDFDPEGDFRANKKITEQFDTLSHIFHQKIKIQEKQINPIRALNSMDKILQIIPFVYRLKSRKYLPSLSMKTDDYLLKKTQHPKLLIPVEVD